MKQAKVLSFNNKFKVLLVENNKVKAEELTTALDDSNYRIEHISNTGISLLKEVENIQPDLIIIDIESPDRDMLESLFQISQSAPKPIVMFSEQEDQQVINQLVKSGVSAYVVGDVNRVRVKSVLDIAMVRFTEYQGLKKELEDTKQKLTSQKNVEKAKRWLMEYKHLSEADAYHSIRKMAMDNSQKMDDVAKNILSMAAMFEAS
jgi:response regulator NasT